MIIIAMQILHGNLRPRSIVDHGRPRIAPGKH